MACPITISKFIGTVSLGLLTGISYTTSTIHLPSLTTLPTSQTATQALTKSKHLTRKHTVRLTTLATTCLLFAYGVSPRHRKHPYLVWMGASACLGTFVADYVFHGVVLGLREWVGEVLGDFLGRVSGAGAGSGGAGKDEKEVNGESVRRDVEGEMKLAALRGGIWGVGFVMGVVGVWGDRF